MGFRVLNMRLLGRGGLGAVYLGERDDTGETVVVKYLVEADHSAYREQFAREVRVLSRAVHRRVMRVVGCNLDAPRPFYVMPYARGGSLDKRVGRLSSPAVVACASQIAEALVAMHASELIHGDVKPHNVLIDGSELRVSDPLGNGAGCTVSFGTKWGGTPGYMAPELRDGCPISKEGDVFAFGATLFHLATGRRPTGNDLDARRHRPAVDPTVADVIRRCTSAVPSRRPTMAQVHQQLTARWYAMPKAQKPAEPLAAIFGILGLTVLGVGLARALSR